MLKLAGHIGTIDTTAKRQTRCPHRNPNHRSHVDGTGTVCCRDDSTPTTPGEESGELDHQPGDGGFLPPGGSEESDAAAEELRRLEREFMGEGNPEGDQTPKEGDRG